MGKGQLAGIPNWFKNKLDNLTTKVTQNETDITELNTNLDANTTSISEINRNFAGTEDISVIRNNTEMRVITIDNSEYRPIVASDFKTPSGSMKDLYDKLKWKSYEINKSMTTTEQTFVVGNEAFSKAKEYIVYLVVGGASELHRSLHIISGMGHVGTYLARGEQTATPYVRIAGSTVYFGCYSINNLGVTISRIYYR